MEDTIISQLDDIAAQYTGGIILYAEANRQHGEVLRAAMRAGTRDGEATYMRRRQKSDTVQRIIERHAATTPGVLTAGEYYDLCAKHDWYHGFSDDFSVDQAGAANYQWLSEVAKINPGFAEILKAWAVHKFSGQSWGTEQAPRPERPQ